MTEPTTIPLADQLAEVRREIGMRRKAYPRWVALGLMTQPQADRSLAAFLTFADKAPLVTFHSPFVAGHLQECYREHLGVDFQPRWIDLAWLLPSLFPERSTKPVSLDDWLEMLGIGVGGGRRDTMSNTLVLARLFQMLLVRANDKNVATAQQLIEESQAATRLRRTI